MAKVYLWDSPIETGPPYRPTASRWASPSAQSSLKSRRQPGRNGTLSGATTRNPPAFGHDPGVVGWGGWWIRRGWVGCVCGADRLMARPARIGL